MRSSVMSSAVYQYQFADIDECTNKEAFLTRGDDVKEREIR